MSQKIYKNQVKLKRAEDIINLVTGDRPTKDEIDVEVKTKFAGLLKEEGIDASKKAQEAIEFVYVKLGGLVQEYSEVKPTRTRASANTKDDEDEDEGDDDEDEDA